MAERMLNMSDRIKKSFFSRKRVDDCKVMWYYIQVAKRGERRIPKRKSRKTQKSIDKAMRDMVIYQSCSGAGRANRKLIAGKKVL